MQKTPFWSPRGTQSIEGKYERRLPVLASGTRTKEWTGYIPEGTCYLRTANFARFSSFQ